MDTQFVTYLLLACALYVHNFTAVKTEKKNENEQYPYCLRVLCARFVTTDDYNCGVYYKLARVTKDDSVAEERS